MADAGSLWVRLGMRDREFRRGLDRAESRTRSFKSQIERVGGVIAGAFAVRQVIRWGNAAVDAAHQYEVANRQLLRSLEGNKEVHQSLIELAEKRHKVTLFSDEENIAALNMLSALELQEYHLRRLLPLVQDFAAEQGLGLEQAAQRVARTIGNQTDTFARYGAELSKTNSHAEAANELLQTMGRRLDGTAEIAAEAGAGPLMNLRQEISEISEALGRELLPVVNETAESLMPMVKAIQENADVIVKWVVEIGKVIGVIVSMKGLIKVVKGVIAVFSSKVAAAVAAVGGLTYGGIKLVENWDRVTANILFNIDRIKWAFEALSVSMPEYLRMGFKTIRNYFAGLVTMARAAFDEIIGIFRGEDFGDAWREAFMEFGDMLRQPLREYGEFLGRKIDEGILSEPPQLDNYIKKSEEDAIEQAAETGKAIGTALSTGISDGLEDVERMESIAPRLESEFAELKDITSEASQEITENISEMGRQLNETANRFLTEAITTFASGMAEAAMGAKGLGDVLVNIAQVLGQFMQQVGAALISYAIAAETFQKAFSEPRAALIAGIALVAAGAALQSYVSKAEEGNIQGLASGGVVKRGGVFEVGERGVEHVALPAGSAVTSNRHIQQDTGRMTLSTRVSKNDLLFILNEGEKSFERSFG